MKRSEIEVVSCLRSNPNACISWRFYMSLLIGTQEYFSKETIQWEIKAHNRTGTVEQMDINIEAMARDLQEMLKLSVEQKRLWDVYERK